MRVVWNELSPNDRYVVRMIRPISLAEMGYVSHLYLPLVGLASHSLYQLLVHDTDERSGAVAEGTHRGLMLMTSLPLDRLLAARERLEAMGLLDVRRRENRERDYYYEYTVKPPLAPHQFFQEDIWPTMLLNQVGKVKYEQIRRRFADQLGHQLENDYIYEENLTKRFYEVYHTLSASELTVRQGSETEGFFQEMQSKYPAPPLETQYEPQPQAALDLSFVRLHLPSHVKASVVLTADNIAFLYKLIAFYQMSSWMLGQELRDWNLFDSQGELDKDALRKRLREKYVDGKLQREQQQAVLKELSPGNIPQAGSAEFARLSRHFSPLFLLESAVGGRVSKTFVERAEQLLFTDELPSEVANALLLYALKETNMELPKTYVETVRDSWKAKQVSTVDEAVRIILERNEAKTLAKHQATERAKASKEIAVAASTPRRGNRAVMQDKLPASVLRQMEREQAQEKADRNQQSQPEESGSASVNPLLEDPELKALYDALRKSQKKGGN